MPQVDLKTSRFKKRLEGLAAVCVIQEFGFDLAVHRSYYYRL